MGVLREAGGLGVTVAQIAGRIGRKREVVSHYLWIMKKAGRVLNRERNVWVLHEETRDPFGLSLDEFKRLRFEDFILLSRKARQISMEVLNQAFTDSKIQHAFISNGKVIYTSTEIAGISKEKVNALIEETKRPGYIFSREDFVEESHWSRVNDDFYPTIKVSLARTDWSDGEVTSKGREVDADFDTGNPYYLIFDENEVKAMVAPSSVQELHQGLHLGRPYWYFVREMKIGVRDIEKRSRVRKSLFRLVKDWPESPLVLANPRRAGYTGRSLMFDLRFVLTLNPRSRISIIDLLE